MKAFTIGFTKTSAEHFFTRLQDANVVRIIDIRLNNTSQLAGFAKGRDLAYFLKTIAGIEYVHLPQLAPTKQILEGYKKGHIDWSTYEERFIELLRRREVAKDLSGDLFEGACLLCSEPTPERCHRRLVLEHLNDAWGNMIRVSHL